MPRSSRTAAATASAWLPRAVLAVTLPLLGTAGPVPTEIAYARTAGDVPDIASRAGIVFVDAMKQAPAWRSDRPLDVDESGNVASLERGQAAETVLSPGEAYPGGDYTLLFDGKGSVELGDGRRVVVERAPGRRIVRIAPRNGAIRVRLTATDPDDPVRNIRLILPGFAGSYARAPFHPRFLNRQRAHAPLRFKSWMHADTFVSSIVWPNRPTTTRFTQNTPAGVAPEYMVALANALHADPWFTLPVGATDMYIYQFAAIVHRLLDPDLHATFEYGDRAWQPGTRANAYAAMAGRNFHLSRDPAAAAFDWYAVRSMQMHALIVRAFGPDAERAREAPLIALARTSPDARKGER